MVDISKLGAWHISSKGYPRFHSGKHRGKYVHRVRMELKLGRKLLRSEDVHHKNGNKLDFRLRNLQLLDHAEHGYVSAKQRWYVQRVIEPKKQKEWEDHFATDSQEPTYEADVSFP